IEVCGGFSKLHSRRPDSIQKEEIMPKRIPPVPARLVVLCLCLAFSAFNAFAQSEATTGNVEGRVLDPNGAVVPNATVTANNQATGLEKTATTDGEGNYRFILLPPGAYTVRVQAKGFPARRLFMNVPVT